MTESEKKMSNQPQGIEIYCCQFKHIALDGEYSLESAPVGEEMYRFVLIYN